MEELLIVTTGGTIDKIYFDDKSDYQIGDPQIGMILRELGVTFRFTVIPILRKDSLHITDADRELIRATIAAQSARHVLVTHGTDSMVRTGAGRPYQVFTPFSRAWRDHGWPAPAPTPPTLRWLSDADGDPLPDAGDGRRCAQLGGHGAGGRAGHERGRLLAAARRRRERAL